MSAAEERAAFSAEVRERMAQPDGTDRTPGEPEAQIERLQEAQHARRIFWYTAVAGTTIEQIMTPGYWRQIASITRFMPCDRVEVMEESGAWYAEMIVVTVRPEGAVLAPIKGVELHGLVGVRNGPTVTNELGAEIQYRGIHLQWCVVVNREVVKEKCRSHAEAGQWLYNYARTRQKKS